MTETIKDKLGRLADPDRPHAIGEYWNACDEAIAEIERLEAALSTANDRSFAAGVQFAQRLLGRLNIRRHLYDGRASDAYRIAEELLREEMAKMEDTEDKFVGPGACLDPECRGACGGNWYG